MRCQNCGRNEAEKTFVINWMGTQYEVHICNQCLEQMWQYATMTGQREAFKAYAGWWPGKEDPQEPGYTPFPREVEQHLKKRMRIAALKARMEDAAEREEYEEAARLRDSIAALEQEQEEEMTHES